METKTSFDLITIANCSWLVDAELIRGQLESAGIEAYVQGEYMGTINVMATGMNIRVQVRSDQVEEARALLAAAQESAQEKCPYCGSSKIEKIKPIAKNWLLGILGLLVMVPTRGMREQKICATCKKPFHE